jgi:hypothetical protein
MKTSDNPADKYAGDPSLQGNMSVEAIIKRDWERNFKGKTEITEEMLAAFVALHAKAGKDIYRLRNTLFLVTPENDSYEDIEVHAVTADVLEVFLYAVMMFAISMNQTEGTQEMYTYTPDKSLYRRLKRMFKDFISIQRVSDPPEKSAPYLVTLDVQGLVDNAQKEGAKNG